MKKFNNYLIRKGLDNSGSSPSGSDCFLVRDTRGDHFNKITVKPMTARDISLNRDDLGIELKTVYESRSGSNWVEKIVNKIDEVDIFKINSYRTDFNGAIGLQFVETNYGGDIQIFLPYNYENDEIDSSYPAIIINRDSRIVVVTYATKYMQHTLERCEDYFVEKDCEELLKEENVTKLKIAYNSDIMIIDDRYPGDRNKYWGTFENPSKYLKVIIRLMLMNGAISIDQLRHSRCDVWSMADLGIVEGSSNMYGFEVIDGEIRRFTKYASDLWVEIPAEYGGIKFIKTKDKFIYHDRYDGNRELLADTIIKVNSPDKGVSFIGFNMEDEYVFQTITYNVFGYMWGVVPEYEIAADEDTEVTAE